MSRGKKPTVLLIESETMLRRLISLGLQDQGIYVIEASEPTSIPSFDTQQLELVVIDVDRGSSTDWSFLELLKSHSQLSTLPTIVLAWDYAAVSASPSLVTFQQAHPEAIFLTKPFDARALHEGVSQLLQVHEQQEAQREALVEERLLASYAVHAAPSIWPVVTAVGLLMIVCGLLVQFAISALGIFIVVAALLLWTVGSRPEPSKVPLGI